LRSFLITAFLSLLAGRVGAQSLQPVNGTKLFIHELGKGEVVIVVHGGPGMNFSYLLPHIEPLANSMKLILYDQRGCGKSLTPAADSMRLSFHIGDIEGIRKRFGVDKVHLMGHSWGAFLAVAYGVYYPDRVKSLILVDPTPLSSEYSPQTGAEQKKRWTQKDSIDRAEIVSSAAFKSGNADAYENLLRISFRHAFYHDDNFEKLKIELPDNYKLASQALFAGLSKDLTAYDYYGSINGFRFPMMVIHGKYDATPLQAVERIHNSVGTSVLTVYEASGHFAFIEENERFTQDIRAWVRSKSAARRYAPEKPPARQKVRR
jgi:proline iminopeptidase